MTDYDRPLRQKAVNLWLDGKISSYDLLFIIWDWKDVTVA